MLLTSLALKRITLNGQSVRTTKNLYFGCYLSKSKEFFYREMAILFPVKSEMAILFFAGNVIQAPPLPPSYRNMITSCKDLVLQVLVYFFLSKRD